jgi:hypothetical protein
MKKRGGELMTYRKPEIVVAGSALAAIQSTPAKPLGSVFDPDSHTDIGTVNAYEADE